MLTATEKNQEIRLANKTTGKFSFTLEPVAVKDAITLNSFEVRFTNEDGDTMSVVLDYGTTNYVSVELDGAKAGLVYPLKKNTLWGNRASVYTKYTSKEASVVFDQENMVVLAGAKDAEMLVWDFKTAINDGRDIGKTFDLEGAYTVSFVFRDFKGEQTSVLMRSVNDLTLDALTVQSSGQPKMYAKLNGYGLKDTSYKLPEVVATDIYYGNLEVTTEVYSPLGQLVSTNAKSFTPSLAGTYTIFCYAENPEGTKVEKTLELEVYDQIPDYTYEFVDGELIDGENSLSFVGEKFYIPEMSLKGGLNPNEQVKAKVTVKYNGTAIAGNKNVDSGRYYTFTKAGVYEICYDLLCGNTKSFFVSVSMRDAVLKADVKNAYVKNEVLDIRSAKLLVENKTLVECDIIVEYPDGRRFANDFIELKTVGKYTIIATAKHQGKTYASEKTFEVFDSVAGTFSSNSPDFSAEYGESVFTGRNAALLNFAGGRIKADYLNAIDISKYTNQTAIHPTSGKVTISENAIPLITISIDPAAYLTAAAEDFYVHLTDAADPNNVLSIVMHRTDSNTWAYIRAKAGDQGYVGFNNNEKGTAVFNGQKGNFYSAGRYGFGQGVSFAGDVQYFTAADQVVTLYYDAVEKQILASPSGSDKSLNWIACDLDDPSCCQGTPWKGFNSNWVYLSVESGSMRSVASKVTLPVYTIDGVSFEGGENLTYQNAPNIKVDKEMAEGAVGYAVKVPTAKAFDSFGKELKVTAKAYKVVGDVYYDLKIIDGKFIMHCEEAVDLYNNGNAQKDLELSITEIDGKTCFVLEASNGYYNFTYFIAEQNGYGA
jgi:hypothetical protein